MNSIGHHVGCSLMTVNVSNKLLLCSSGGFPTLLIKVLQGYFIQTPRVFVLTNLTSRCNEHSKAVQFAVSNRHLAQRSCPVSACIPTPFRIHCMLNASVRTTTLLWHIRTLETVHEQCLCQALVVPSATLTTILKVKAAAAYLLQLVEVMLRMR